MKGPPLATAKAVPSLYCSNLTCASIPVSSDHGHSIYPAGSKVPARAVSHWASVTKRFWHPRLCFWWSWGRRSRCASTIVPCRIVMPLGLMRALTVSKKSSAPGSPGELPPEAPTDPDVTLSRHPAPVIQPQHQHHASEQKDPASPERSSPVLAGCGGHAATTGCVSDAAMRLGAH